MTVEKKDFKYSLQLRVRNYEVDWQGIVHNANYLLYCEVGRVEYLKHVGARIDLNSINHEAKVVLVRNEIDYRGPAYFDELLDVYTRISKIGNSSFVMEGFIERPTSGERLVENVAYHVWLNPRTNKSTPVPMEFRKLIRNFEGADCDIQWPVTSL